jgi:hypothetical protein
MKPFLLIMGCAVCLMLQAHPSNPCKAWQDFVEGQKSDKKTLLLDFSYAGYHHGEEAVPSVDDKVFNVCDYGAVPDDDKSDRLALERAIKAASKHGSGIIYFPKGRYNLHEESDPHTSIVINSANIIFRGAGCGDGGTEIYMGAYNRAGDPDKLWSAPPLLKFSGKSKSRLLTAIQSDAEKGTFSVMVADASS